MTLEELGAELVSLYGRMLADSRQLDDESARILHGNLWDLYDSEEEWRQGR